MKYYLYQIRNKNTNMIYIGVHCSKKIRDSYMGSGINIKEAIKKEGKENFEKTILEYFDNKENMLSAERKVVNREFINRTDTYNIALGGGNYNTIDTVTVKDINGNTFQVSKDDPRYISGELVHICTGRKFSIETINKMSESNKGLKSEETKKKMSTSKMGVEFSIETRNKLSKSNKGRISVIDKDGNKFKVFDHDPKFISGELTKHIIDKSIRIKNKNLRAKLKKLNSLK